MTEKEKGFFEGQIMACETVLNLLEISIGEHYIEDEIEKASAVRGAWWKVDAFRLGLLEEGPAHDQAKE